MENMRAGIFDGPQTRQLITDPNLIASLNVIELRVWFQVILVLKNVLGNKKTENYTKLVDDILFHFNRLDPQYAC